MSVSRIKTIAIAGLLLVNALFAVLIIRDATADARSERQTIENVCAVLLANGIMLDPDDVGADPALRTMRTFRLLESEEAIARAVLGDVVMTDQGVIYLYENPDRGTAEFYSAGDFEILLNEGAMTGESGARQTVERLLDGMGIEISGFTSDESSGSEVVTVVGAHKGTKIFNCVIEFIFNGPSLQAIRGRHITGIEPVGDDTGMLSAPTALLRFLAAVKRGDVECENILGIEPGYQHRIVGSLGEGLAPAWRIDADSGQYIIDNYS